MDVEKQVSYWEKSAEHDIDTAEILIKEKKFDWALFMGHLVLEKILKAIFVKKRAIFPPKTHNLVLLLKEVDIQLSDEEFDFFEEVNTFNISTRYPDEQFKFYKICTEEFSQGKFRV
jgi:HEPN domain-containing protein